MAVTPTARLGLNKQSHRDPDWHTALDAGFDDADARFFIQSTTHNHAALVRPVTFIGVGLNNATSGGTFVGTRDKKYVVQIDGTGSPNTFRWSADGGQTYVATLVAITGAAQTLNDGVTITFATTTGHTLNDLWEFFARAAQPLNPNNIDGAGSALFGDYVGQRYLAEMDDVWWTQKSTGVWIREKMIERGALSVRPANPLIDGILYFATDTKTVTRWNSTTYRWEAGIVDISAAPTFGDAGSIKINSVTGDVYRDTGAGLVIVRTLPPNHLTGGIVTWNDATHLTISASKYRDILDLSSLSRSSMQKVFNLASTWSAGAGGNMRPSAVANANGTQYLIFEIAKPDGTTDWGIDTSTTATSLLVNGYTMYRRIGYIYNDSATGLHKIVQRGDTFIHATPKLAYGPTTADHRTNSVAITLAYTPPLVFARLGVMAHDLSDADDAFVIGDFEETFASGTDTPSVPGMMLKRDAGDGGNRIYGDLNISTNAASQIRVRSASDGALNLTLEFVTHSWIDLRDKDA